MQGFFDQGSDNGGDALLYSQGRIKLYFHVFRRYKKLRKKPAFSRANLEKFNADVTVARSKSQRAAQGLDVTITPQDRALIAFDLEKQSTDDSAALVRQYNLLSQYLKDKFQVSLPTTD